MIPAWPNKKVTQCFIAGLSALSLGDSVASAGRVLCGQHWLKGCLSKV